LPIISYLCVMKATKILCLMLLLLPVTAQAQQKVSVKEFRLAGPYAVAAPATSDTVDVNGRRFDEKSMMNAITLQADAAKTYSGTVLPSLTDTKSVGVLTFYVNNADYVKGRLEVKGPKHYKLYVDGAESDGRLALAPEHHTFAIRYLAEPNDSDSIRVTFDTQIAVRPTTDKRHPFMIHDLTDGRRVRGASLSPDGRLVCISIQTTERGGKSRWDYELKEVKTGRLLMRPSHSVRWMPRSTAWLEEQREQGLRVLYKVDPLTGLRTRWAAGLPEGGYTVSPTEDYLIITASEEGPKEDADVFEVLEMDDRQPGWRQRSYLVKHDVATGISQRITFGPRGQYLYDISADGRTLLVGSSYSRLSRRPTEVQDICLMDCQTLNTDTLFKGEGFLSGVQFAPDGRSLLFRGTPEAFDRIGCVLPESVTPNMYDYQLFLYDLASRKVTPLTRDFDPSPTSVTWSETDGQIYFTAEDRDFVRMYTLNPKTGTIRPLPLEGENILRYSMASRAAAMVYLSTSAMQPTSAYVASPLTKSTCLYDGRQDWADVEVGTCRDWNFRNSKGDIVYGRLYLPAHCDTTIAEGDTLKGKKLPLIVYYYGGCSPVSRAFESTYSPHYWTSLGYAAYILQPSGCSGFGQEWGSRHVNTAGGTPQADGTVPGGTPAGDIIEGVRQICAEHPFIDATKVGCMGASYGGFMTMYLQTVTDIFAAAVSHAGIANHTSYWGEGYWGYNYSEVSMANSYPWSHRQLYVDQSPLFRADKIHTPLLLLHGTADTNVPIVESLQMFTALKLLGRPVALVEVKGENHHVLDYAKKEKWLSTQMAWFQRWLKGDATWWDALYPKKNL